MDALDCILSRRSRREWLKKPVEFEKVLEILQAGHAAPSCGNIQNWEFLVLTDRERISKLPGMCAGQHCVNAGVVILVLSNSSLAEKYYGEAGLKYTVQNCAAVTENMLLAANALGLGAVWIGSFDEDRLQDLCHIPSSVEIESLIALGYSAEKPLLKHGKPLQARAFFNVYGGKIENLAAYKRDYGELFEKWSRQASTKAASAMERLRMGRK